MKAVLVPLAERIGRLALRRRGVAARWVQTPHGRLHVYDASGRGKLPPIVLLHGLGSASTPFGPLLARLRPHARRVIAPDLLGHGFSDEHAHLTPEVLFDSVSNAIEQVVDEPVVLVGNSLGGAVALNYAISHPARVRALVLVSPAGAHSSAEEWDELKRTFSLGSRKEARAFIDRLYHRPPWITHLIAHELPSVMARRSVKDLVHGASNEHFVTPDELGALQMPILFLWGESERLLPDSHFDYFERHLPKHAVIDRPRGFGHCPHFDDPAELARRITRFAREQATGT